MGEGETNTKGSIAYFATYRPPVPLDVYTCPIPPNTPQDELHMTDGISYNYNARPIPPPALNTILQRIHKSPPPSLAADALKDLAAITKADVESSQVLALVVVSERAHNLETLHFVVFENKSKKVLGVVNFGELYGIDCNVVRMEDSGCFAGDKLIYVTTKDPNPNRRQPWTAVYATDLKTGYTERLTPEAEADLSPSVSPSGKMIAVASLQSKGGWEGEIEDLKTDIFVMNVENPFDSRREVVNNGGWPTWGDEDTIFFHRRDAKEKWGVYRADISKCEDENPTSDISQVSDPGIDAMTPAAIDATTVVVATFYKRDTKFSETREESQYRHIEIIDMNKKDQPIKITQKTKPMADHYNPFVIVDNNGGKRVGYHRCRSEQKVGEIQRQSNKLLSPLEGVGLFRVPGVFPTFSTDGTKLAFVDNEFKNVWIADNNGLRVLCEMEGRDCVFCPVWNKKKDILYVCVGPSFHADETVNICEIDVSNASDLLPQQYSPLTNAHNNAFPSTNPQGTKLVFRSTRGNKAGENFKNLYIMEDAEDGEFNNGEITRLTEGKWYDTHCQWSPKGDWIVFSSTRDKEDEQTNKDVGNLDSGSYAVYLVKVTQPDVVIRVLTSSIDDFTGHVTHPFFSPDGKHLIVTSDLAAISADPISMPLFLHSVRPYGEIFGIEIDPDDMEANKDIMKFCRLTHSRYENGIAAWTKFSLDDPKAVWNKILDEPYKPICPYIDAKGGESWNLTGHLNIPKRCC